MDVSEEGNRVASLIKFSTFCHLLEKLRSTVARKTKENLLIQFINLWEKNYLTLVKDLKESDLTTSKTTTEICAGRASFYPALRLLLPQADKTRPAYGLRETMIGRLLIKAFGLAPNGPVARQITLVERIQSTSTKKPDFADIVHDAVQFHCREDEILFLKDVNDILDNLAKAGSSDERSTIFNSLVRSTTALELKWIVRLIVSRDSCCVLNLKTILKSVHPDAPSLWEVTQNLVLLCQRISTLTSNSVHDPTDPSKPDISPNQICLFIPFRPMLCERANSPELLVEAAQKLSSKHDSSAFGDTQLILETKYDGERVQIHKSGDSYRYWSRNCLEWTSSYGPSGTEQTGSLTFRLHAGFAPHVQDCILDGEMMAYNIWSGAIEPKTSGFDVKRPATEDFQPCFIAFDIVYLNGQVLTNEPILVRKRILSEILCNTNQSQPNQLIDPENNPNFDLDFVPQTILPGALYLANWQSVQLDLTEISRVFNYLIDCRQEGLVAKLTSQPFNHYGPGQRNHAGWWKLKPDYVQGLVEDLDCLVVGAYLSKTAGTSPMTRYRVNQFLCAVRNDKLKGQDDLPQFSSFCRVSTGLTIQQHKQVTKLLQPHWKVYDRKQSNSETREWLHVCSERPDLWIAPQFSVTFQLRGAELVKSDSYATGLTLRFPRVISIRDDKSWHDCLTLTELEKLNIETEGKLVLNRTSATSRNLTGSSSKIDQSWHSIIHGDDKSDGASDDHDDSDSGYKTRTTSRQSLKRNHRNEKPLATSTPVKSIRPSSDISSVIQTFSTTDEDPNPGPMSSFLEQIEICLILSADFPQDRRSKLEDAIRKAKGYLVLNPTPKTYCVVIDKLTVRSKNLIQANKNSLSKSHRPTGGYDVVHTDWLTRCLEAEILLDFQPADLYATSLKTSQLLDQNYDIYGDSFTNPIRPEELKVLFEQMDSSGEDQLGRGIRQSKVPLLDLHSKLKLLSEEFAGDVSVSRPLTGYFVLLVRPDSNCSTIFLTGSQFNPNPILNSQLIRNSSENFRQRLLGLDLCRLGATVVGPVDFTIPKSDPLGSDPDIRSLFVQFLTSDTTDSDKLEYVRSPIARNLGFEATTHIVLLGIQHCTWFKNWVEQILPSLYKSFNGFTRPPHLVLESWALECIRHNSWIPEAKHAV